MTPLGAPANDNDPLTMTRPQAAALCGITTSTFDVWVRKGIVPAAIPGTRRWSRGAIMKAIAGGSAVDAALSPYEKQKAERNARKA